MSITSVNSRDLLTAGKINEIITAVNGASGTPTFAGNLTFTGTGNRITGDFSNAANASRVLFQTSTVNSPSSVGVIPNGTSVVSSLMAFTAQDPSNSSIGSLSASGGASVIIAADKVGTGTYLPLTFQVSGAEKVRISTTGGLSVGTTVDPGAGSIYATGNITAYYSSDRRLKENIVPISGALALVNQISGNRYDWKDSYISAHGGEDGYFMRKQDVGVIAQEVQAVLPEVVAEREDGFLAVNYEKIVPLLIEAIKELSAEVAALKAR